MSSVVLDASALLALLVGAIGNDVVADALQQGACISAINLSEVVAKLADKGMPETEIHEALDALDIPVMDFDASLAYQCGLLRPNTRDAGLSLGDRACLALAMQLGIPALTADRAWETLDVGVTVHVIR